MSWQSSSRAPVLALVLSAIACLASLAIGAEAPYIVVASTTSTEESGLFGHILPVFEKQADIDVRVVAVGTGQAIELAKRGDADVLFVHHKPSELQFVAEGYGAKRYPVMWNDFIIVGPKFDPAGIGGAKNAAQALAKIARAQAPFASRGDDSGTHKKELELWKAAGVDAEEASGIWYRELGQGMGPTLNTAAGMNAYTLTDRGTWLSFGNRRNLVILAHGDPTLFNQYAVILVSPEKHPHVKAQQGQEFIDWLTSKQGQHAIGSYKIDGQRLFHPNAGDPGA
jgi:tungstate transport system substrate-binding protein